VAAPSRLSVNEPTSGRRESINRESMGSIKSNVSRERRFSSIAAYTGRNRAVGSLNLNESLRRDSPGTLSKQSIMDR